MAKGWINYGNNSIDNFTPKTKAEQMKKLRNANNMIKNMKTKTYDELVEAGMNSYNNKIIEENRLIELVESGKVTSKELVEKVAAIKKSREKNRNKNIKKES